MTKICKELAGHILTKWPQAALYLQSGSTIHDYEITLTCADYWFISLSSAAGTISAMICLVTRSVQSITGYTIVQQYNIDETSTDGRYLVRSVHQQKDSWMSSVYWSLTELVTDIEKQIACCTASGDGQPDGIGHKYCGEESSQRQPSTTKIKPAVQDSTQVG